MADTALIVGAGSGLSASVARKLAAQGWQVALAARSMETITALAEDIGGKAYRCDARNVDQVAELFEALDDDVPDDDGGPDFVLYNASARTKGPIAELDPSEVERVLMVSAFGGFLVAREAARRMVPRQRGAIFFTGASASVKGFAHSAPFAMGKFALRGLAQSMARELHPKGIHVAHFVIDGAIETGESENGARLDPDAIAQSFIDVLRQDRSACAWEVELRPWKEPF